VFAHLVGDEDFLWAPLDNSFTYGSPATAPEKRLMARLRLQVQSV